MIPLLLLVPLVFLAGWTVWALLASTNRIDARLKEVRDA